MRLALAGFVLTWIFGPNELRNAVPIWLVFLIALGLELNFFVGALRARPARHPDRTPLAIDRERYGYGNETDELLVVEEDGEELWIPYSGEEREAMTDLVADARSERDEADASVTAGAELRYSLELQGRTLLLPSPVSLTLGDGRVFGRNPRVLKADEREMAEEMYAEADVSEVPFSVWIDDGAGLPRRVEYEIGGYTETIDFLEFGQDVNIDYPSEDRISDLEDLFDDPFGDLDVPEPGLEDLPEPDFDFEQDLEELEQELENLDIPNY